MHARRLSALLARLRQCNLKTTAPVNLKLLAAFLLALAALVAQDPTSYLTPDVTRVGGKLACRCGGCRNTVGNCPMLRCDSADPMRRRIYSMKARGMSDGDIVNTIVREQGIVALASPPAQGFGPLITWVMPGIALLGGFFIYSWYVRRNRKEPEPLTPGDQAIIDRFRAQIDRELDESPASEKDGASKK
jgi:cytochrome c-type biogenesis protein CcmH/NrfF